MKHILFEGDAGSGKSTLINKLLPLFSQSPIFGFYTKKEAPEADGFSRVYIHDAKVLYRSCGEQNCVALCGPDGGKANVDVFNRLGVELLCDLPEGAVVVMDELGVFESKADAFCRAALDALNRTDITVIGAVKTAQTEFLQAVKQHPNAEIHSITRENREFLGPYIINEIKRKLKGGTQAAMADFTVNTKVI